MSKSIRSVLETLVAGIEACVENNKVDIKQESVEVDQAIKDIAQIIDEAKPENNCLDCDAIDLYQSNLREALK